MYFLMNLITPGRLLMMLDKLAAIAKKPSTWEEVKNVPIDNPQIVIRSKCFINCKLKIVSFR